MEPPEGSSAPIEARMDNARVVETLQEIAELLEIQGENSFKIAAYRRAAATIEELGHDVAEDWRQGTLGEIPGIGAALEQKLDEMLRTGRLEFLTRLRAEVPVGVVALLRIPGVGPRTARLLWEHELTTVDDVARAARAGQLRVLPGLGVKTEARILAGIEKPPAGSGSARG